MIDSFWFALFSCGLSLFAIVSLFAKHREQTRREGELIRKESLMPDAVQLPTLKADVEHLKAEREQLEPLIADAKAKVEYAKNIQNWLNLNLARYEKAVLELPALKGEIELRTSQRDALLEEGESIKQQYAAAQRDFIELQKEIGTIQQQLEKKKIAEAWLQKNLPTYEAARDELPRIQHDIAEANDELQERISDRDELQTRIADLHVQHAELLNEIAPARLVIEQRDEAADWLADNRGLYEAARSELPVLRNSVEAARDAHDELVVKLDAAREKHGKLIGMLAELEIQCDGASQELDRIRSEFGGAESEKQRVAHEIAELQARQAGMLIEVEQSRVQRDGATENLKQVRSELDACRRELKQKTDDMAELESQRAIKLESAQFLDRLIKKLEADKKLAEDELSQTKARLQRELDQINALIEAAVKRWSDVGPTVGANDANRLAELWQPVLSRSNSGFKGEFKPTKDDGEHEALERTSQHLQRIGLRFGKRVLHAFHTSLKVAEMSPLVVLAGISGTGKSELPRRYAEGMGMHSLTLAVQPRWDSPQDMFGFYNYLESRYRATELARALVQMDRFAKERKAEWNYPAEWEQECLSDRMLLVLLDEMNLARVEYYFSEFLSKLETRRGINPNNPIERNKAEIQLEVGLQSLRREDGKADGSQKPTLPLFVDRNVLFVGTMNEDESTQTLSDKVVDRANVLRFGKPQKLGADASPTNSKPTESWLSFDTWEKWIVDEDKLRSTVRDEFNGWVHELNHAMQEIGRPFAHRTHGAMLSYIANYPEPDQYKLAMADQIELKLLPKFRGLDPSDSKVKSALGTMQKLVEQMGDERLLQALREASKQSEHHFVWHGVDRTEES